MNPRFRWLIGLLAIVLLAVVGVYAYNLGVAHGLAESGRLAAAGGGLPPIAWGPGPWGFGFWFFPFWPLLVILFLIVLLRGPWWRGGRFGAGCGGDGVPRAFDDWHRRAHAGEAQPPAR